MPPSHPSAPIARLDQSGEPLSAAAITAKAAQLNIHLVATSSTPDGEAQQRNVCHLEGLGVTAHYHPITVAYRHGIPEAASLSIKAQSLTSSWLADESNAVFALRGGYGAADILAAVDWASLPAAKPIVGFSDVSALQCAFYSTFYKTKRPVAIHGPMIGHGKCGHGGDSRDLDTVVGLLTGTIPDYRLGATPLAQAEAAFKGGRAVTGPVFGGCLSVLTGLIGTPYFPASLAGHILFFEDVGESLHRLVRLLSQWQLAGALAGVQGIVLGQLADCGEDASRRFGEVVEERTGLPCLVDAPFGHVHPNFPLIIGCEASLSAEGLSYALTEPLLGYP